MTLKCYFDLMSQPSRAVYMFLKMNKVPFEPKPVALRKGEHYTDEYKKVDPFSLVPAIDDNGLCLTESIAITKYVIQKFNLADHWFPQKDLVASARVEEYLHWQHWNTRAMCANLFQRLLIIPVATGKKASPESVEKWRGKVRTTVSHLESYFLKDRPYLGGDKISLADIFGACELMQLNACHEEGLYESSPIVKAWMEKVRNETNPYFDEAHKFTYNARERYHGIVAKL